MGTAARIRSLRVQSGKSQAEMALSLGLNDAWYSDLEQNDEELASTLTLFQGMQLASMLGVRLHELLEADPPGQRIPITELPKRIRAHVARKGMSMDQFEAQMGGEVRDFVKSPLQAAAELPISVLQSIAAELGIDWLSLVPEEESEEESEDDSEDDAP